MSRKSAYIEAFLRNANSIATVMDALLPYAQEYFNNGYNGGGSDPITNADLISYDITEANFTNMVTTLEQMEKFFSNQGVTTGDYRANVNQVRRAVTGG